ncbi:MAG: penicillin acylase family protein [Dehalococcoidia bacterium]|nr:penicillin acylase family protein [Dehalococcoidia bacterium]
MMAITILKTTIIVASLVAGAIAAASAMWKRPLPKTRGKVRLPGLIESVEVVRDVWGVPHIFAHTFPDLMTAQGYVHAQDRLWQMDLSRRIATGALSEVFGIRTIDTDKFLRLIGINRAAKLEETMLEEAERSALQAYCDGINHFIKTNGTRLPIEYLLLKTSPKLWAVTDCLAWAKLMAWSISVNWDGELVRERLTAAVGPELASILEPEYHVGMPRIIPPIFTPETNSEKSPEFGLPSLGGSNAWVVSGGRSVTGKPILASDPHLVPQVPAPWYEIHLSAPDLEVTGASIPGLPGVVIGRNRHIAWGITAGMVDTQDMYIEEMHPTDKNKYRRGEYWMDCQIAREEITVRGLSHPVEQDVQITVHGPIITPMLTGEARPMALKSVILQPHHLLKAGLMLNKATNWEEFRAAIKLWGTPSQCFVYADVRGNIGYQLCGQVPVRKKGDGKTPEPGWDSDYDWEGFLPFDDLPCSFNPASGYIVAANNKIWDESTPAIYGEWADGYRAQRIEELLIAKQKLSPEDFMAFHMDTVSIPAREIVKELKHLVPENRLGKAALDMMRDWNGSLTPDSGAAALYEVFRLALLRRLLKGRIGEAAGGYFGMSVHPLGTSSIYLMRSSSFLLEVIQNKEAAWLHGTGCRDWKALMIECLEDAVRYLSDNVGSDPKQWNWGSLHKLTFAHPLAVNRPLARLFNRGPIPLGGDTDTPHQSSFSLQRPYEAKGWLPTYRQIVPLGDMEASVSVQCLGQSGHPASPHYSDLLKLWRRGEYHPMYLDRDSIMNTAEAVLLLEP